MNKLQSTAALFFVGALAFVARSDDDPASRPDAEPSSLSARSDAQAEGSCPCGDSCPCGPDCRCGEGCGCEALECDRLFQVYRANQLNIDAWAAYHSEPWPEIIVAWEAAGCPATYDDGQGAADAVEEYFIEQSRLNPEQPVIAVEPPPYEITLYTADFHCPPCEVAKAELVPWLERYGWTVTVCTADADDSIRRFPTWVVTRHGDEVHRWTGAAWSRSGRATVIEHLREAKGEMAVSHTPSLKDWINDNYRTGQHLSWSVSGMSVRSHLMDGSHGTHVWRREQLDGLSDWEMLCLHDATHRGLTNPREWH